MKVQALRTAQLCCGMGSMALGHWPCNRQRILPGQRAMSAPHQWAARSLRGVPGGRCQRRRTCHQEDIQVSVRVLSITGAVLRAGRCAAHTPPSTEDLLGDLTTLDYLVYLNVCSGRSHSDLAQWPVMPWVLRDYRSDRLDLDDVSRFRDLSRPVGALEPCEAWL